MNVNSLDYPLKLDLEIKIISIGMTIILLIRVKLCFHFDRNPQQSRSRHGFIKVVTTTVAVELIPELIVLNILAP